VTRKSTKLTSFAWTIPPLRRIELYVEPWNTGSIKTAERAGYEREGLLRSHQEKSPMIKQAAGWALETLAAAFSRAE
jgi:RimJ/RimL family protein N-acetyltransferase